MFFFLECLSNVSVRRKLDLSFSEAKLIYIHIYTNTSVDLRNIPIPLLLLVRYFSTVSIPKTQVHNLHCHDHKITFLTTKMHE
jgi:hypothetical protein